MSDIHLRAVDLRRIADAQRLLLSPLDYPTFDAWRGAVLRDLGALVGAEHGGFSVGTAAGASAVGLETNPAAEQAYHERYWHQDECLVRQFATGPSCRAISRPMFWPEREVRRTEFWSDFVVPHKLHEPLALAMVGRRRDPDGRPADFAFVSLLRDRPLGWRHTTRELPKLALLAPAFQAGIAAARQLARPAPAVAAVIDALAAGVVLADAAGRVVHVNTWLARALAADPEGAVVRRAARCLAALAPVGAPACGAPVVAAGMPARDVCTRLGRYHLTGSVTADPALAPARVVVMVAFVPAAPAAGADPVPEPVRRAAGLTPREADVARLLARGLSNAAVARTLGVSPHTAARHTERVLPKLGVHSRAAVAHALRRASELGTQPSIRYGEVFGSGHQP